MNPIVIYHHSPSGRFIAADNYKEIAALMDRLSWSKGDCGDVSGHPVVSRQLAVLQQADPVAFKNLTFCQSFGAAELAAAVDGSSEAASPAEPATPKLADALKAALGYIAAEGWNNDDGGDRKFLIESGQAALAEVGQDNTGSPKPEDWLIGDQPRRAVHCPDCEADLIAFPLVPLEQIPKPWERMFPGEIVPDGECPNCGVLVHLSEAERKAVAK